jgi:hypothetical protein
MKTLTVMGWSEKHQEWFKFQTFKSMEQWFLDRGYVVVVR